MKRESNSNHTEERVSDSWSLSDGSVQTMTFHKTIDRQQSTKNVAQSTDNFLTRPLVSRGKKVQTSPIRVNLIDLLSAKPEIGVEVIYQIVQVKEMLISHEVTTRCSRNTSGGIFLKLSDNEVIAQNQQKGYALTVQVCG